MLAQTPRAPKKTLPILGNFDDIRIASPCQADWEGMKVLDDEGGRARHCGSCEKNVYDLSSMTRDDAIALIARHEGNCCVRFYRRTDGTVLTADCPVGFRAALRKAEVKVAASIAAWAGAAATVFFFLFGANPLSKKLEGTQGEIMGKMSESVPPPPPPPEMGLPPPPPSAPEPAPKNTKHAKPHKKKAPVVAPPETGEIMMGDYAEPEPIAHVEID